MAPSFFGSSTRETSSSVKYFDIRLLRTPTKFPTPLLTSIHQYRLNQSNLILRGTEYEASSVVLKGTLVLCLSEPIRIQGIKLRFTGERRLGSAWTTKTPDIRRMLINRQLVSAIRLGSELYQV